MSSCDKTGADPMDKYLGSRLKNWAARAQPRPIVRRLLLEAASEAKQGAIKLVEIRPTPFASKLITFPALVIDRLSAQGLPAEMSVAMGRIHPTRGKYAREVIVHSFPTGMGIYLLMA